MSSAGVTTFIFFFLIVLIIVSLISFSFNMWQTTPPSNGVTDMEIQGHSYQIGNGEQLFLDVTPVLWPHVINNKQVHSTIVVSIPRTTVLNPALPILFSLPTNAVNLTGQLIFSSIAPPSGQTYNVVQFGPNTLAISFEPSGLYVTGSQISSVPWQLALTYIYNIAA